MAPDTMEKETTHQMLIQVLPFTKSLCPHYVDQQVDG